MKRVTVLLAGALLVGVAPVADRIGQREEGALRIVRGPIEHLELLAREPMLAVHPTGRLFVSGYGGSQMGEAPLLWKSDDDGASWRRVDVGTPADGAVGNSDVDLAIGTDGTIYFVAMGFDRDAGEGTHIAVGVSHDVGETWSWIYLSRERFDDRPWVEVAPDGTAHVIWNDGAGVHHALSRDRGRTWATRPDVHPTGGSSHLAIGPEGELAVRVTPLSASGRRFDEGVDVIAVSDDAGDSWSTHVAPGRRRWSARFGDPGVVPRWVEPVAWDGRGALYHLWSEGREVWLGRSEDRGATWSRWRIALEDTTAFFPYLTVSAGGRVAATWFIDGSRTLSLRVADIGLVDAEGAPRVALAAPLRPDTWLSGDDRRPDTAGEYAPVVHLADGTLAVVTTIQDPGAERFGFAFWTLAMAAG